MKSLRRDPLTLQVPPTISRREVEVSEWADPPIRKAKKAKQRPDDSAEDQLRELYTLVPVAGPLNNKEERIKWFKVFCNVCKKFNGCINCDRLQDYDYLQHHAAIIHGENETKMEEDKHDEDTSMVPGSSSDFSEGQLRKIYDLVPKPGMLSSAPRFLLHHHFVEFCLLGLLYTHRFKIQPSNNYTSSCAKILLLDQLMSS